MQTLVSICEWMGREGKYCEGVGKLRHLLTRDLKNAALLF